MVSALGPATSTGVMATDILPAGLTFVSATTSRGSYASSTGTWTIGDMSASSTATLTIAAIVNASSGTITNTATVDESASSTDPDMGNNAAAASLIVATPACTSNCGGNTTSTPSANLAVTKIVDNATPYQGNTVHYTIVISDPGPASSTNVVATDTNTFPSGLVFVSATTSQGSYASSTGTWLVGNMAVGSTATMIVTALVNASSGTTIVNTVDVNGTPDPSASATITVATSSAPTPQPVNPSPGCSGNCGGSVIVSGGGSAYDLTINGGASSTATTSVMLSLYGTEAYTMEVSNTSDFSSSTWIPYSTTLPWIITSGSGQKTVYVQYRAVTGTTMGTANASIDLIQGRIGKVLGASISCGVYLDSYIRLGADNDPTQVKKLQLFLNQNLGTNLPITGYYGRLTYHAVEQFQVKYKETVLLPWIPYGLANETTPTGYVYKTTKRWINELMCPPLDLPLPQLP